VIPASFVRFATYDPASVPELRARAERAFNGPGSAQARLWAVGYTLFFARRYGEAAAVWKQLYDETSPNEQAPAFLYAGALVESGHAAEAAPLLKANPIPSVNVSGSFESLYFPKLFEWRGDHATYLKLAGNTGAPAK
jgi:hypothetical protein